MGVSGFVALQVVIDRSIRPLAGNIAAASAQFLLAVVFWWWSLHCLLSGRIRWRRLFAAGLATAVCCTGLGVYITYVMSFSLVSSQARYGPIGTVITLITAEIGLAVACNWALLPERPSGPVTTPAATVRAGPGPEVSQFRTGRGQQFPARPAHHTRRPEDDD